MSINNLLVMELDSESPGTRKTLERVPMHADFTPHAKSMTLGNLATHLAEIPGYGIAVVTQPELNFATSKEPPPPFESGKQLIAHFDGLMRRLRDAVSSTPEGAWLEPWRLLWGDKVIFEAPRFVAYRSLFMNHLVHHRAQLGTYLRQTGVAVPSIYGPSADEQNK